MATWITVLAVGLFGGDMPEPDRCDPAAGARLPVTAIVPFAFVATIFVGRWGLGPASRGADPEAARPPDPCSSVRPSVEAPDAPHAPRA